MKLASISANIRTLIDAHAGTFARFVAVGAFGFLADYAILIYLVSALGADPFSARVISVTLAILLTWALNKSWSFRTLGRNRRTGTLLPYYGIQLTGALLNFATYSLILILAPFAVNHLIIPMAFGSAVALFFNYLLGRRLFRADGRRAKA